MLSNLKHVSTLPSYVAIINSIFAKLNLKEETANLDEMEIKYKLVLHGTTQAAAEDIEYNTLGAF